jgi:hypothetical protein
MPVGQGRQTREGCVSPCRYACHRPAPLPQPSPCCCIWPRALRYPARGFAVLAPVLPEPGNARRLIALSDSARRVSNRRSPVALLGREHARPRRQISKRDSPPSAHLVESGLRWRGGRVVECGGLENRCASLRRTEGSNPSPSAHRPASGVVERTVPRLRLLAAVDQSAGVRVGPRSSHTGGAARLCGR